MTRDSTRPTTVDEYTEWNAGTLRRNPVSRRSLLKGVVAGAGGIALVQFGYAQAAFAAAGGKAGSSGLVVAGRHLSFMSKSAGEILPGMALTAQIVSRSGSLPKSLRAFVDVGTEPGRYGASIEGEIVHLVGQYAIPNGPVGSQFYAKFQMHLPASTMLHYRVRLSDGTVTGDASFPAATSSVTANKFMMRTASGDVPMYTGN